MNALLMEMYFFHHLMLMEILLNRTLNVMQWIMQVALRTSIKHLIT